MCLCSGPVGSRVLRLYRAAVRIQPTPQYYNTDGLNGEVCHILKSLRNFAVDLHTIMSFLLHTQIIFMQCVGRELYDDRLFFNVAEPALAFTHSPGCMFITDQKAETLSPLTLEPAQCPLTICISQNPQFYSMASKRAIQQIRAIEELVVEDPGMKKHSFDPKKACECLRCTYNEQMSFKQQNVIYLKKKRLNLHTKKSSFMLTWIR